MGNCLALCKPSSVGSCIEDMEANLEKVLRVVKTDGKVLEFRVPILVKDIMVNFSGSGSGSAGISVSKQASQHLPPDYELKIGHVYYMIPLLGSLGMSTTSAAAAITEKDSVPTNTARIKIVITKLQLQELLTKQISVQQLLSISGPENRSQSQLDSATSWQPKLETIPEETESSN